MFSFRRSVVSPVPEPADPIKCQAEDVRYVAEQLIVQHIRANGLHKISKEAVRHAMQYAHAMRLAGESYERELRAEALRQKLETEQFHPESKLEEEPCDA